MGLHKSLRRWISSIDDVECYLKRFPNGLCTVESDTGQLPLHTAVQSHVPNVRIVEYVIERYPIAVSTPDNNGRLPLHTALAGIKHVVIANDRKLDIVKLLYNHYPQATRIADSNGYIPLHYAILGGLINVIQFLIQSDPGCVRIPCSRILPKDDKDYSKHNNNIKTHEHVQCKRSDDSKCNDRCIKLQDLFPLHMLLHYRRLGSVQDNDNIASIKQRVLLLYPTASQNRDQNGDLPLHLAVQGTTCLSNSVLQLSLIKSLILFYPFGVSTQNYQGQLPLHCALYGFQKNHVDFSANGSTLWASQIVKLLIHFYRDGLYCRDGQGLIPLHVVCSSVVIDAKDFKSKQHMLPVSLLLMDLLLDAAPDTIRYTDPDGNTPLHMAVVSASRIQSMGEDDLVMEIVRKLVERCPEAARIPNKYGNLPLHECVMASKKCNNKSEIKYSCTISRIVQCLLAVYPDGVLYTNNKGELPIHVLATNPSNFLSMSSSLFAIANDEYSLGSSRNIISNNDSILHRHILHYDEASITGQRIRNNFSGIPRNEGCTSDDGMCTIVDLLVRQDPSTLLKSCKSNGNLPIHSATQMGTETVLKRLLHHCPQSSQQPNAKTGMLPVHYAVVRVLDPRCRSKLSHNIAIRMLHRLIRQYPCGLEIADNEGRLPLHIAYGNVCGEGTSDSNTDNSNNNISSNICYHIDVPSDQSEFSCIVPSNNDYKNTSYRCAVQSVLLRQYPQAVLQPDRNGMLPLHIACRNFRSDGDDDENELLALLSWMTTVTDASTAVRKPNLIGVDVQSTVLYTDKFDRIPLHWLLNRGLSMQGSIVTGHRKDFEQKHGHLHLQAICMLTAFNPDMTTLPTTHDQFFPLFLACEANASLDVVHYLLTHSLELFPAPSGKITKQKKEAETDQECFATSLSKVE